MSRFAFIASLAIHAALLLMVWWWFPPTEPHVGPGDPGAGVTFLTGEADGLRDETATNHPPDPAFVAPALALPEPFAPAPVPVPQPIEVFANLSAAFTLPAFIPTAAAEKTTATKPSRAAPRGNRAASTARGSGSGNEGRGLAETGCGNGSSGFMPPQFRLRYKPPYPAEARAQRLEGVVLLLVSVDATGGVTSTHLLSSCGHAVLDRAALDAVGSWRFDPARQHGVTVAAQVEVPVRFRFEQGALTR